MRRGSGTLKRGRGTWIPKAPAKKLREGDGVAEPAAPTSPAHPEGPEGSPSPAKPTSRASPERSPSPAKPTSPASVQSSLASVQDSELFPSPSVEELEPSTAYQKVKEVEASTAEGEVSTADKNAKELKPSTADADKKVKEVEANTADGEASIADKNVKELKPSTADKKVKELELSTADGVPRTTDGDQVHHPPLTMSSAKGIATMLTRKGDREASDFYTAHRKGTKEVKASGSPANSSSSQDSSSSSKHGKFRKITHEELDEISKKDKKASEELRNQMFREQWRQQRQRQQQLRQHQQQLQPKSVELRLRDFLDRFDEQGTKVFFYVKKVNFMRALGSFKLEVDFNHILRHDFELASDIVNYSSPEKFQTTARDFIMMHVSDEDKKAASQHAYIAFVSMPYSFIPVTELLKDPNALVDVYMNGCNLSVLGASLFGGFLEHFLDTHSLGRAYNGAYDLNDMYVINKSQFFLKKEPSFVLEGDTTAQFLAKKLDMIKLIGLFTPHVDCRNPQNKRSMEPPEATDLPIFLMQFYLDIQNVSKDEISKPWFRAYILNSPALKMPQARHDLVCASHLALKRPLSGALYALITENPCPGDDWRPYISNSSNDVLREVYHYRENDGGGQTTSGSVMKQAAVSGSGASGLNQTAASGAGLEQGAASKPSQPEPFELSYKGIITCDRNLKNHGSKKGLFTSIAELEVFTSTKLFEYLPKFVKQLFYMEHNELMKELLKDDFKDILADFKSSRIRTIDGSEIKATPQLFFWQ